MRTIPSDIGIASSFLLLSLIPSTQALPPWLQAHDRDQDVNNFPPQYTAYEQPTKIQHYSYGGHGPAPTMISSSSTRIIHTSENDGETSHAGHSTSTTVSTSNSVNTDAPSPSISIDSTSNSLPGHSGSSFILPSSGLGSGGTHTRSSMTSGPASSTSIPSLLSDLNSTATGAPTADGGFASSLSFTSPPPYYVPTSSVKLSSRDKVTSIVETSTSLTATLSAGGGLASSSSHHGSGYSLSSSAHTRSPTSHTKSLSSHSVSSHSGLSNSLTQPLTSRSCSSTSHYASSTFHTRSSTFHTDSSTSYGGISTRVTGIPTSSAGSEFTSSLSTSKISHSTTSKSNLGSASLTVKSSASSTKGYPTTEIPLVLCHHNNCLRQFIASSEVVGNFCATYTREQNTATAGLPPYVSKCDSSPSKISSACSCLVIGVPATSTPLSTSHHSSGKTGTLSSSAIPTTSLPAVSISETSFDTILSSTSSHDDSTMTYILTTFKSSIIVISSATGGSTGLSLSLTSTSIPFQNSTNGVTVPCISSLVQSSGIPSHTSVLSSVSSGLLPNSTSSAVGSDPTSDSITTLHANLSLTITEPITPFPSDNSSLSTIGTDTGTGTGSQSMSLSTRHSSVISSSVDSSTPSLIPFPLSNTTTLTRTGSTGKLPSSIPTSTEQTTIPTSSNGGGFTSSALFPLSNFTTVNEPTSSSASGPLTIISLSSGIGTLPSSTGNDELSTVSILASCPTHCNSSSSIGFSGTGSPQPSIPTRSGYLTSIFASIPTTSSRELFTLSSNSTTYVGPTSSDSLPSITSIASGWFTTSSSTSHLNTSNTTIYVEPTSSDGLVVTGVSIDISSSTAPYPTPFNSTYSFAPTGTGILFISTSSSLASATISITPVHSNSTSSFGLTGTGPPITHHPTSDLISSVGQITTTSRLSSSPSSTSSLSLTPISGNSTFFSSTTGTATQTSFTSDTDLISSASGAITSSVFSTHATNITSIPTTFVTSLIISLSGNSTTRLISSSAATSLNSELTTTLSASIHTNSISSPAVTTTLGYYVPPGYYGPPSPSTTPSPGLGYYFPGGRGQSKHTTWRWFR